MRGHDQPGGAIASPTERLLRSLLAADGRQDADARVVEGVRSLLAAEWVAIVEHQHDAWRCRAAVGSACRPGDVWSEQGAAPEGEHAAKLLLTDVPTAPALGVDLDDLSRPAVLLVGSPAEGRDYGPRDHRLLERIGPDLARTLQRADEMDRLRSQAFLDALTNCYNRRGFDEHLAVELRRAQRYERSAALMLVDLDGFKRINDELGHQAGDHVLRCFAGILTGTFRNTDIVSRYGGDEFAVVFPETTTAEADGLAQRVRRRLSRSFPDEIISRPVSASFGIASYPADAETAEELIATADRALYAAKVGGRDRVVSARPRDEAGS